MKHLIIVLMVVALAVPVLSQERTYDGRAHTSYAADSTGNTIGGAGPWVISAANDSTVVGASVYIAFCPTAKAESTQVMILKCIATAGDTQTIELPALHHFRAKCSIANYPYHVTIHRKVR